MNNTQPNDLTAQTYQMPPANMNGYNQPFVQPNQYQNPHQNSGFPLTQVQQQPYYQQQQNYPQQQNNSQSPQYSPQQQPYPQQPMILRPPQQMVPMVQTTVISTGGFGGGIMSTRPVHRGNQNIFCPNCKTNVITNVEFEPGGGTWIMCLILAIFVGLFGFIVFCCDECKDVNHHCCRCGAYLGKVRYLLDD